MTMLLAIIRALHFGACLLPLSVFTTMLFVVNPSAGQPAGDAPVPSVAGGVAEHLHRQLRYLLAVCFITAFASGFLWLWFSIAGMNGSPLRESLDANLFKMVLTQTRPGQVWMLRAVVALLCAAIALPAFAARRGFKIARLPLWLCALAGACLAGSLAWLGHAGASEGSSANIHLAADVLHLLSAAVWPGSLLPFALLMRLLLKSREPALLAVACVATRRFSSISLAAVGFLAGSGSVNSWFLVGNIHALFSTEYGRLLLVKLAIFTAMVAIGAINLLHLKPRLSGAGDCASRDASVLKQIARNVFIELCLGTVVLLVVGILGITPPAVHS